MNVGTENPVGTRGVNLAAGTHRVRVEYVCAGDAAEAPSLTLTWRKK